MTPRLLALSLAPLLATGTAFAQAPGEMPMAPPPSAPAYAPSAGNPCSYAAVTPMAHRFAIGLSIGGFVLAPDGAPEGTEARFRGGELAIRYRASRRLELELALAGGRQVLEDDTDGDLAAGSVALALRYRLRPERRWGIFLMGGIGGAVVAPHESTEAEREGATRPFAMLGVGVERRFRRFALQAELRVIGMGPRQDAMEQTPIADDGAGGRPLPRLPEMADTTHAEELTGGMFTLGASYYF